jgi:hypothetical protein
MLVLQLLMTIPALLASSGSASPPISYSSQAMVGELTAPEYSALAAFEQSVQDYVALHRRLARVTPPLQVTADPAQLRTAVDSLGQAIRLARPAAQRGDVFTVPVARLFRQRIGCALWTFDVTLLTTEMEGDSESNAPPVVNGSFPWGSGNAMWPSVLAALPPLPEELEYRFVGADLVLVDVRADLVVDILKAALPAGS